MDEPTRGSAELVGFLLRQPGGYGVPKRGDEAAGFRELPGELPSEVTVLENQGGIGRHAHAPDLGFNFGTELRQVAFPNNVGTDH